MFLEGVVTDLSEFLNLSIKETVDRLNSYSTSQLSPEWDKLGLKIYTESDIYLYDLAQWNTGEVFEKHAKYLSKLKNLRVLDFGGGIGTMALHLSKKNKVTYYDLPGRISDFAKFRFFKHGASINVRHDLDDDNLWFDVVIALDVMEHVDDLELAVMKIAKVLRPGGLFMFSNNFKQQDIYPMHFDYSGIWGDLLNKYELNQIGASYAVKQAWTSDIFEPPKRKTDGLWRGVLNPDAEDPIVAEESRMILNNDIKGLRNRFKKIVPKNCKVAFAIPDYGGMVPAGLMASMVEMFMPNHTWFMVSNALADVARNDTIEKLLAYDDWTHIWFIDSDVIPPLPYTLMRLLERDKDIVCGLYATKTVPHKWLFRKQYDLNEHRWVPLSSPQDPFTLYPQYKDKLLECSGTGAGCMLIKRKVFESINPPWFKVEYTSGTQHIGEDIYFFEQCMKAGYKIYVDTSLICLHVSGNISYPVESRGRIQI